jgi:16S rRNA (uracil1498-N3)-methyltransferase
LSDQEIALAAQAGFKGMRLGPRILRTETAALVALSLLQSQWGDLS